MSRCLDEITMIPSIIAFLFLLPWCSSFLYNRNVRPDSLSLFHTIINGENHREPIVRRFFLNSLSWTGLFTTSVIPRIVQAQEDIINSNSALSNQQRVQAFLHPVPVFTIVDSQGVPFMVVGEDAKISCYFFTTFSEANRLLSLARNSVDQEIIQKKKETSSSKIGNPDESFENPWTQGRISSVPLDFAVGLAKKGKIGGAYFYVAPEGVDVEDALLLNPDVPELGEGQVPLFYMQDFTMEEKNPLFFHKNQLVNQWKKYHPHDTVEPQILVTELSAVSKLILSSAQEEEDLQSLVLIPPPESTRKAKECLAQMKTSEPFQLGKRILVL